MDNPLVSIIIPTKNSAETIETCLKSIKAQTYSNIEVLVVDNHSTDKTSEIVKRYNVSLLRKGPERTAQLNYGIKNAQGDYIYRIDSDFILDTDVVEKCVRKCEVDGCDAILVPCISVPKSFWSKVRWLERISYLGEDLYEAARFFKREVIDNIGGFDENLIANEDYDVQFRLVKIGARIGRIKQSAEWHPEHHTSLGEIVIRNYYYGKSIGKYIKKHHKNAIKQLFPIKLCYIKKSKLFSKYPKYAIGFMLFQFTRYLAAFLGHLSNFL